MLIYIVETLTFMSLKEIQLLCCNETGLNPLFAPLLLRSAEDPLFATQSICN